MVVYLVNVIVIYTCSIGHVRVGDLGHNIMVIYLIFIYGVAIYLGHLVVIYPGYEQFRYLNG